MGVSHKVGASLPSDHDFPVDQAIQELMLTPPVAMQLLPRPSRAVPERAFWVCPCAAQCSPCGCLSLGPCAWRVCLPPVAVSFHGHISGTQTPAPCARPLTGPCPATNRAFPSASGLSEDLASSASPSVCTPARSPQGRAPCVVEIFAGSCNFSSTAVSMG